VLFMMPEIIAGILFPRKKWENNLTAYRVLCGIGVVGNLLMMMMANLVGFAVGVDGLKSIIHGIFRDYSGLWNSTDSFVRSMKLIYCRSVILGHCIIGVICRHPGYVRGPRSGDEKRHFLEVLKDHIREITTKQ